MGQTGRGANNGISALYGDLARAKAERRHSFRVNIPARASLWRRGELCGYYAVLDISIGGCSLAGETAEGLGDDVDVVLHVPHRAPLVLPARVQRISPGSVGLRFVQPAPVLEEELQDIVVETYAHEKTRETNVCLVVEPRHAERHTLVRTLRELGKRAVGVATALDAVQLLVEEAEHVEVVFIEAETSSLPCMELVEFLAHNHPNVRRVLIGNAAELADHWLEEASGEVHALLDAGCDRETLHRILRKLERVPANGN